MTAIDPDRFWKSEVMHNDLVRVGVLHHHLGDPPAFQPSGMVGPSRYDTLDNTIVAGANRLLLPEGLRFVSSPLLAALGRAGIQLCSLAVGVALALIAIAASAQPSDTPIPPSTPAHQPVPKSDEHRIVGKVLELDRESSRVKLATEEGVIILEVPEHVARALRVGDTVSVPRSSSKPPSASPRQ